MLQKEISKETWEFVQSKLLPGITKSQAAGILVHLGFEKDLAILLVKRLPVDDKGKVVLERRDAVIKAQVIEGRVG
ncbi:hypothetical protein SEA_MINIFLAYER_18 [Satellite phage MiniFlayer]|nr:hypothetical protein SEA_MINIFLAYER_18 [Satellite phage MiniFlayer]